MSTLTFGYAMCGSFCTFKQSLEQMKKVGANVISAEMILFWHIESAKVPNFKDLSNLVK